MPHDQAFATQARAADTLRWGGRTSLSWGPHSAVGGNSQGALNQAVILARGNLGSQLVNAHWRWPVTWRTLVCLRPQFAPDETGSLVIRVDWTIGSGDAQQTFSTFYTMAPSINGTGYNDVIDTSVVLPACDIQVTMGLGGLLVPSGEGVSGPNTASVDALEVGVFVAPYTEVHTPLHVAEMMSAMAEANRQDGTWMPGNQFNEEPLGYRR